MAEPHGSAPASININEQVADLRSQLDSLIEHQALPMINDARAGVASKVGDFSGQVRSRPIAAVAITAVVAFLAGRLLR